MYTCNGVMSRIIVTFKPASLKFLINNKWIITYMIYDPQV